MNDLKFAFRQLLKNPGFTAVAVLTLALGIGANTAIFSVVNAVLLRPLPFRDPNRLAMLWTEDSRHQIHEAQTSCLNFEDWQRRSRLFEDMALFSQPTPLNLTFKDDTERVDGVRTSANLFSLLGVQPMMGRSFSADEAERKERVVVLSHGLWLRRFGGEANVIGKSLWIEGRSSQIIGVMPAGFDFPGKQIELWEPHTSHPRWDTLKADRYYDQWEVVGRFKPKVTPQQAQAEMTAIGEALAKEYPTQDPDFAGFGVNVVPLMAQVVGTKTPLALSVLFGAVILVLLIACANVAGLLLARGTARAREIAIRTALGATRAHLTRQLLAEGTVLALGGGAFGVLLAEAAIRSLVAIGTSSLPRLNEISINGVVLIFAAGVSLVSGVICTVAPAWMVSRSNPNLSLKQRGPTLTLGLGGQRMRHALVTAQIALVVVLLTGAGLLIRSLHRVLKVDVGFQPERVLVMQIEYPQSKTEVQVAGLYQQVLERVAALPGVKTVGAVSEFFIQRNPGATVTVEGERVPSGGQLARHAVSRDFFQTLGVELVRGRYFSEEDFREMKPAGYRVTIINETMARRLWPGVDPIGKRFKDGGPESTDPWLAVVGVVRDIRRQGLEQQPIMQAFVPRMSWSSRSQHLLVRTEADPALLASSVREVVRSIDKTLPLFGVTTAERWLNDSVSERRFHTLTLSLFSCLTLLLAVVGIFGLLNASVVQRTHEMGIRMALGAQTHDVLRLVVGQGMRLTLVGLATGLVGASVVMRVMTSLLYEIKPTDPFTFVGVSLVLFFVALLACWLPARRAARIDPMEALRYE